MTLADLANVATLVSGVAVAASLIYLAFQLRQSARHQRGTVGHGRAQTLQDLIQSISASPKHMEIMLRGWAGDKALGRVAFNQFYWSSYSVFITFEDTYHQHRDGMIGRPVYDSALRSMSLQLSQPGARAAWRIARETFEPQFVAFLDGMASAASHSRTADRWEEWLALVGPDRGENEAVTQPAGRRFAGGMRAPRG